MSFEEQVNSRADAMIVRAKALAYEECAKIAEWDAVEYGRAAIHQDTIGCHDTAKLCLENAGIAQKIANAIRERGVSCGVQ